MRLVGSAKVRTGQALKLLKNQFFGTDGIVPNSQKLRDLDKIIGIAKGVGMLGRPFFGNLSSQWQTSIARPGAEKWCAAVLFDSVEQDLPRLIW
jgi:hypothetical protein